MTRIIRDEQAADHAAVNALVERAFGQADEARLVAALRADGDVVCSMVAVEHGVTVGHILFSRLNVETPLGDYPAVALAPLAVDPAHQRSGTGSTLVREAHEHLASSGETLSFVVGDPAYYSRFGYDAARAAGFDCEYAGPYLQALAFSPAPAKGRLRYAPAFSRIGT